MSSQSDDAALEAEHFEWPIHPLQPKTSSHRWKKQGERVVCTCCLPQHGFLIPPSWTLTGTDEEGQPVLERH